jgi:hypothetical protein
MNIDWKVSEFELPPSEGTYHVSDTSMRIQGCCYYDGWGFLHDGHYVEPELWKNIPDKKKRFGKIKELEN